jgi:hypothetical protein
VDGAAYALRHLFHACYGDPNDLQILGVWETREGWDKFWNEECRPIMIEMGFNTTFTVYEVHSVMSARELIGR